MQINKTIAIAIPEYDPSDAYFPGATQPSPPAVAKVLSVYKDELVRPIAFDLGHKGDSRAALRELCQKAVLEIAPIPENSFLQTTNGFNAGGGGITATAGPEPPSNVNITSPITNRSVRLPRMNGFNLDEDIQSCVERNRQNIADIRALEQERQDLIRMPDLFQKRIQEMDDQLALMHVSAQQERQEMEAHIVHRVMTDYVQQRDSKLQAMYTEFDQETAQLRQQFAQEEKKQIRKQERSFLSIIQTATRKLQKGQTCDCKHQYMCRHNKSASYNTRHVSRTVLSFRANAKRLASSGREAEALQWEARAHALDAEEEQKWREEVAKSITHSTWGAKAAQVDLKAEGHKKDLKNLKEKQDVRVNELLTRQEHKLKLWEVGQQAEERRVRTQCRKMIRDIFSKVTGRQNKAMRIPGNVQERVLEGAEDEQGLHVAMDPLELDASLGYREDAGSTGSPEWEPVPTELDTSLAKFEEDKEKIMHTMVAVSSPLETLHESKRPSSKIHEVPTTVVPPAVQTPSRQKPVHITESTPRLVALPAESIESMPGNLMTDADAVPESLELLAGNQTPSVAPPQKERRSKHHQSPRAGKHLQDVQSDEPEQEHRSGHKHRSKHRHKKGQDEGVNEALAYDFADFALTPTVEDSVGSGGAHDMSILSAVEEVSTVSDQATYHSG